MSNLVENVRKDPPARPRSVCSNGQTPIENSAYQLFEMPAGETWPGVYASPGVGLYRAGGLAAPLWRQPRAPSKMPFLPTEDSYYYPMTYGSDYIPYDADPEGVPGSAVATPHGTISLRLNHKMRVDLTIDRAVRVINFKNNIVIAMNSNGSACALLHPNGRVHQYGSRVEIMANDTRGNHKFAKMWYKGVSFTSENCALVYLVDSAGTRTTTDNFSDLSQDFSLQVYYSESRHGMAFIADAITAIQAAQYWVTDEGVENWIINNVRISQAPDGLVRVARNSNKYHLRTSAANGTATITTPFLHCTASMGSTSHLFVRRGERRMHFDGTSFIVRNAGHSAGFDEKTQLKVF
uniref:Sphingosine-1-phosphate lyase 1 n=1 Tax=Lygus hesperus TaxID=30085 RepID=A0A0A9XDU4_LYGHE